MTGSPCFVTRGTRAGRIQRLPAATIHQRGTGTLPSARYGSRWSALPVEGSKAWRDRQPILSRIFSR